MTLKSDKTIIKVNNLSKSFLVGNQQVKVLKNVSFEVKDNDFLIIFGPSGCGKSTLLHTILGLEEPSGGSVTFLNQDVYEPMLGQVNTEDQRSEFRKLNIGMVYQQANWIRSLKVWENVAFPLTLCGVDYESRKAAAKAMLTEVEMADWADYLPTQLSSGQQQKVALARAIISNPRLIIADEPTGNLDFESGKELMGILSDLNTTNKKTIIMVTHDLEYLKYAKTIIKMFDGQISEIRVNPDLRKTKVGYKRNGGKSDV